MDELETLVAHHGDLSAQLAASIRDGGMTREAIATTKREAWMSSAGVAVTERKEYMNQSVAHLVAELANTDAESEALRVELNHVELQIRVLGV